MGTTGRNEFLEDPERGPALPLGGNGTNDAAPFEPEAGPAAVPDPKPGRIIPEALMRIACRLTGVGKDGQAGPEMGSYRYTTIEGMLLAVRPLFLGEGIRPSQTWQLADLVPQGEGPRWLLVQFRLEHVSSGEELLEVLPWPMVEKRGTPADKALAAALSSSMTYWIRGLLMLPRGEDMDGRNDSDHEPQGSSAARAGERSSGNTPQPASRPAQGRPAAGPSTDALRDQKIQFGDDKGRVIRELTQEALRWHLRRTREKLGSAEFDHGGPKRRFRQDELKLLRGLEAEVLARGGQLADHVEG